MRTSITSMAHLVIAGALGLLSPTTVPVADTTFDCSSLLQATDEPRNPADLCWLLQSFVESHDGCEFPRAFLDRITTGGKTQGIARRTTEHKCLKQVTIQELRIEDNGVLGDLTVKNKKREYVSVLVYSGDKWLMYWPTEPVKHVY